MGCEHLPNLGPEPAHRYRRSVRKRLAGHDHQRPIPSKSTSTPMKCNRHGAAKHCRHRNRSRPADAGHHGEGGHDEWAASACDTPRVMQEPLCRRASPRGEVKPARIDSWPRSPSASGRPIITPRDRGMEGGNYPRASTAPPMTAAGDDRMVTGCRTRRTTATRDRETPSGRRW